MIKGFDELSDNNQKRMIEAQMFLLCSKGLEATESIAISKLIVLLKTAAEWRRYRGELFRMVNDMRKKMGLKKLGA